MTYEDGTERNVVLLDDLQNAINYTLENVKQPNINKQSVVDVTHLALTFVISGKVTITEKDKEKAFLDPTESQRHSFIDS